MPSSWLRRFCLVPLLLVLILISGCSKSGERTTQIEFWTLQLTPEFTDYFLKVIAAYEESHSGVTVKWVDVPYDAAVQKLLAAVAAGNPPDVVNLSSNFLSKFYSFGALMKLNGRLPDSARTSYLPNAMKNGVYSTDTVALPWYLNTYVLIYNNQMLREAGFSGRDVPQTFDGMVLFARRFKDMSGKFAFFLNIGKDSFLPMVLESEGIHLISADGSRAIFNSPEGVAAVEKWVRLFRDGYLPRETVSGRASSLIEPYMSGQVASVFTGPVFLGRVRANAPAIYDVTGTVPALVGKTGESELAVMSISIMATTKHPREAVDFALYVTNAENQLAFSKIVTTYPSVTSALDDPFFTKDDGTPETHARVTGAKELPTAKRLRTYFAIPDYDMLTEAFDEAIQTACLDNMSTKDALDRAAGRWNAILRSQRQRQ